MTTDLPSLKIALVCGGTGAEHIGSIESALWLLSQFRPDHRIGFFYQHPDGRMVEAAELPALFETWAAHPYIKAWTDPSGADHCRTAFRRAIDWQGSAWTALIDGGWDLVWPAFHGRGGEDGSFQGLCESLDLPYAGCGIAASVLCVDKIKTKAILRVSGLPVLPEVVLEDWELGSADAIARLAAQISGLIDQNESGFEALQAISPILAERIRECETRFSYPVFVKPASLGSSLGITKATDRKTLANALLQSLMLDRRVLVEPQCDWPEYGIGLCGLDEPEVSLVVGYALNPDFFDYEAKFGAQAQEDAIPARLDPAQTAQLQQLARSAWHALELESCSRVDCFWHNGQMAINEVNTMPGFGAHSVYAEAFAKAGLPAAAMLDRIIAAGLERHQRRNRLSTHFKDRL